MKKILFIANEAFPFKTPTGKIIKNIISRNTSNLIIDVLSTQDQQFLSQIKMNRGTNFILPRYQKFLRKQIFYNFKVLINKARTLLNKLFYIRDFALIHSLKKFSRFKEYDEIIAFSGSFSTPLLSLKLKKKYKINFSVFYCDPIIDNLFFSERKIKIASKFEQKWLQESKNIFMPQNYCYKIPKYLHL